MFRYINKYDAMSLKMTLVENSKIKKNEIRYKVNSLEFFTGHL
jgi:hypothetical protein